MLGLFLKVAFFLLSVLLSATRIVVDESMSWSVVWLSTLCVGCGVWIFAWNRRDLLCREKSVLERWFVVWRSGFVGEGRLNRQGRRVMSTEVEWCLNCIIISLITLIMILKMSVCWRKRNLCFVIVPGYSILACCWSLAFSLQCSLSMKKITSLLSTLQQQ